MIDRNEEKLLKDLYLFILLLGSILVALFLSVYIFLVLQFIADEHFTLEYGDPFYIWSICLSSYRHHLLGTFLSIWSSILSRSARLML